MGTFVRAIVYGFGYSLGAALYRRVSAKLGIEDDNKTDKQEPRPVEHQCAEADNPAADTETRGEASDREQSDRSR